ncbi:MULTISPECIES: hypothetical protein [Gimesia]|uniref:Uncharacterized protein n=2 Tax=Gimesia TaxID=1649453 RepID=A0A6I6AF06_9PLAN|nr:MULTISPECIES: hypothetical protein [Gimesia]KAA0135945.1 hypothetical protein FYZ48_17605 [Gimesia chilikensis]MCR9234429.1 hypothetical protein [bacterium]QGQ23701.1 hypothetical protein F1728_13870 [Gimesia benthica]
MWTEFSGSPRESFCLPMAEIANINITEKQLDLLLSGLRYVKSAEKLRVEDPTPEYVRSRTEKLEEITALEKTLNSSPRQESAAQV